MPGEQVDSMNILDEHLDEEQWAPTIRESSSFISLKRS